MDMQNDSNPNSQFVPIKTASLEAPTVRIFDTTLRDGEQAPGFTMNAEEKMRMAQQLAKLGVNTIEAGFAASSPGDFESVREIGHTLRGPMVVSLCRTNLADIDSAVEALKGSPNWGIHTFIASSPLHMKYKLNMDPETVLASATKAVEHAKRYTNNVEFSPEDATRSEIEFLIELCNRAIAAGATVINIPDTVGYTTPIEMHQLITRLVNEVKDADKVDFSVHCHNDLGLAVANSIAAVNAGARQVECTVNGIGERAGNAAMEEIVMALRTRQDYYNQTTSIVSEQLYPTSRLLSQLTGMDVQANKAIVGANAFAHEAGIHQDGMLKNPLTYEIMTPESVGIRSSNLVLGKHSGRHALIDKVKELGYELSRAELNTLFAEFKKLADRKKTIYDEDIEALLGQQNDQTTRYVLNSVQFSSGTDITPEAKVSIGIDGQVNEHSASGNGAVEAIFNAIKTLTATQCNLNTYKVSAITGGTDAVGEVTVSIEENGKTATARGIDPDVLIASAKAFVQALNRLEYKIPRMEGI